MKIEKKLRVKKSMLAIVFMFILVPEAAVYAMNSEGAGEKKEADAASVIVNLEVIERNRADISYIKKKFLTHCLLSAAQDDRENDVIDAVNSGADINAQNDYGSTPLVCAARRGQTRLVCYLLQAKADIHVKNKHGYDALRWATESYVSSATIVKQLLQAGADVNESGALQGAASGENKDNDIIIALLIRAGAYVNKLWKGDSSLHMAFFYTQNARIKMLLSAGACPRLITYSNDVLYRHSIEPSTRQLFKRALEADALLGEQNWMPVTLKWDVFFANCMPATVLRELIGLYATPYDSFMGDIDMGNPDNKIEAPEFFNMLVKNQLKERERDRERAERVVAAALLVESASSSKSKESSCAIS